MLQPISVKGLRTINFHDLFSNFTSIRMGKNDGLKYGMWRLRLKGIGGGGGGGGEEYAELSLLDGG